MSDSQTPKTPGQPAPVGGTDEQKVSTSHAQETGGASVNAEAGNLPAAPGTTPEPEVVAVRKGMFGTPDSGLADRCCRETTSAYCKRPQLTIVSAGGAWEVD